MAHKQSDVAVGTRWLSETTGNIWEVKEVQGDRVKVDRLNSRYKNDVHWWHYTAITETPTTLLNELEYD